MHSFITRCLAMTVLAGAPAAIAQPCDVLNPPNQADDTPDIAFFDANADGIDGMACGPIFVDTITGADSNLGDMDAPMKTIGAAILAASAFSPPRDVYVSMGTYNETVILHAGVDVYGGYDASLAWARSLSNTVHIVGDVIAMYAQDLPQPVTIDLVTIQSDNASAFGQDSIAVLVRNAPNGVVFSNTEIVPGDGGAGQAGANGAPGSSGGSGANGATGRKDDYDFHPFGGNGGFSPIGNNGGRGGDGGWSGSSGNGQSGSGGVGPGGTPGSGNPNEGDPGGDGGNGGAGTDGGVGAPGANASGALYSVGATANSGANGGGGGGGGGGAAQVGLFVTNGSGNAGGGGGGGGRGGFGGQGGSWGGSSFGIVTLDSDVSLDSASFFTGNGGAGGNGGNGGGGGSGGNGGSGGAADLDQIGRGGNGGKGGNGGSGGKGGGGVGGSTIGVFAAGAAPGSVNDVGSSYMFGLVGPGGLGASPAPNGLALDTFTEAIIPPGLPSQLPPTSTHTRFFVSAGQVSAATDARTADPDLGDAHTIALTSQPANGIAAMIGNQMIYAPNPGFTGVDFFTYDSTDSSGAAIPGYAVVHVSDAVACLADIDGDNIVSGGDLSILLASWGSCP